jgi:hypothetical protein
MVAALLYVVLHYAAYMAAGSSESIGKTILLINLATNAAAVVDLNLQLQQPRLIKVGIATTVAAMPDAIIIKLK